MTKKDNRKVVNVQHTNDLKIKSINAIRFLAVDQVGEANSGHPGIALGAAPIIYTLFRNHLKFNPLDPEWSDRDRFVLSAGHGSALLYATLHISGFNISMDELKRFRQLNSITPGHPEFGHTPGVDCTTGPLGQGIAMAVGMAMAEVHLSKRINTDDYQIYDHYTYVLCGDGDLQEGISHEAASLAGNLKLNKLIVLLDSNHITLDGELSLSSQDKVAERFASYNWAVIKVDDGNDLKTLNAAIKKAKKSVDKPTLIIVETKIGYGSPKEGTSNAHGSPLNEEETLETRKKIKLELS